MRAKTILFCGGGSMGHIFPSVAVYEALRKRDPTIRAHFLCSTRESEKRFLSNLGVPYSTLHAPRFPRALSIQAVVFPFLFLASLLHAFRIFRRVKPSALFAKGGYVSVAPSLIATAFRIPVILHTSDAVPNVSDAIVGRIASVVCTGFPLSEFPAHFRKHAVQTGNPVRQSVFYGDKEKGLRFAGMKGNRPIVLVMGGSQGAVRINQAIDQCFDELLGIADVIHITGEGKEILRKHSGYASWPSVDKELPDLIATADLVVTRAGAGALSELATQKKACIILPLEGVAHDHQLRNAEFFVTHNAADMLREGEEHTLFSHIKILLTLPDRRAEYQRNIAKILPSSAAERIAEFVLDALL